MDGANLIVNFRPFTLNQEILVYEKGECVKRTKVRVDDIPSVVNGLKAEYNIAQINLCGNTEYLSKYKALLQSQFDNNNVDINIYQH